MNEADFHYCCGKDGHGLKYPGFSIVFLQIFSLDHCREFVPSSKTINSGFITPKDNGIDNLIFNLSQNQKKNIRRYDLLGFDFKLPLDDPYPLEFSGRVQIEMSLFFEHTVSISYRFLFDGNACLMSEPASTDHIIGLLSTHLSAEHWSKNKGQDQTDINHEVNGFVVNNLMLSNDGKLLDQTNGEEVLDGAGRVFDAISNRYKKFIRDECSIFKSNVKTKDKLLYKKLKIKYAEESRDDFHYAMVDIWENLMHPIENEDFNYDLFSNENTDRLTEAEIVNHIRDYHKPELIGLMTLYPGEWLYRDPEAYTEVCGNNIAIDTDDLVLVNNNICVVIGTYGRRGGQDSPVDWEEHLQERSKYHVSWPEYLLILEMVLAKKYVIAYANDQLIDATLEVEHSSSHDLIAHNAELSMRLSRMELQLDVVKYSKFTSHKVMFDRTTDRLELEKDTERLHEMMEVVDSSLHNLSDYKSMKSDFLLNIVLAIISVASTFELFFQNAEMPFLTYFGIESGTLAAVLVWIVAAITSFALMLVIVNSFKSIHSRLMKYLNN